MKLFKHKLPIKRGYCWSCAEKRRQEEIFIKKTIIVSSLFIVLMFFLILSFPSVYNVISNNYIKQFKSIAIDYEDNELVESLYTLCDIFPEDELKIKCVTNFVTKYFNYVERGGFNGVKKPKDILIEGGICRDYSVLYYALFDLMGLNTTFIDEPNHVYIEVTLDNYIYEIDQDYLGKRVR